MTDMNSPAAAAPVLVSDFDGTMTRHDFYKLAIEKLLPEDFPDQWADYRAGRITHFEALRRYFAAIRCTEEEILQVVSQMELDRDLSDALQLLQAAGWNVVVASAGCEWYIRRLLAAVDIEIPVYSNPGQFDEHRGLMMHPPTQSPYFSEELGISKRAIVEEFLRRGAEVAFAGDGFPDADAARLVPAERRFARGDLADVLRQENLEFHPLESWSDISDVLAPSQG